MNTTAYSSSSAQQTPLRLWPGVVAVAVQWLIAFGLPVVAPRTGGLAVIAGVVGLLVVAIWWLAFSRAPWLERLAAFVWMSAALAVTGRFVHVSVSNGMMGFFIYIFAAPLLSLALIAWALWGRKGSAVRQQASMAAAMVFACLVLTIVRTNGVSGDGLSDLEWRWTQTAEDRLLATAGDTLPASPPGRPAEPVRGAAPDPPPSSAWPASGSASWAESSRTATTAETTSPVADAPGAIDAVWSGFRGPGRDSVIRGVRIATDWSRTPPVELWRRPIGPGWSSFAVAGDLAFTQEQRGEEEVVSAYRLANGTPVWAHRDAARFWESNAGAGPRATPTFDNGRIYTLGGTGILNVLDARNGSIIWSRNAAKDTGATIPDWGISSSPLVVGDVVVVATAGTLAAYDLATGTPRWFGPKDGWGYSSPQLMTVDGVSQIVLVNGPGAIGVASSDGTVLWKHEWRGDSIVQPAVVSGNDLLIGSGSGLTSNNGVLRFSVAHDGEAWSVQERWASTALKAYFNDFVVHQGYAFGFDGSILSCVSLDDGRRVWKGGRYGHGQLVLLADQNVLLVLSEEGELALVSATADAFTEIARIPAISGKTWNHPVLAGDILLVRNSEEMAAFRLSLTSR